MVIIPCNAGWFTAIKQMTNGVSMLGHYWFIWWLVACVAPSNYLSRCWLIITRDSQEQASMDFFIKTKTLQEIAFQKRICKTVSILLWPQNVKGLALERQIHVNEQFSYTMHLLYDTEKNWSITISINWIPNKMADILYKIFSNASLSIKLCEFLLQQCACVAPSTDNVVWPTQLLVSNLGQFLQFLHFKHLI